MTVQLKYIPPSKRSFSDHSHRLTGHCDLCEEGVCNVLLRRDEVEEVEVRLDEYDRKCVHRNRCKEAAINAIQSLHLLGRAEEKSKEFKELPTSKEYLDFRSSGEWITK